MRFDPADEPTPAEKAQATANAREEIAQIRRDEIREMQALLEEEIQEVRAAMVQAEYNRDTEARYKAYGHLWSVLDVYRAILGISQHEADRRMGLARHTKRAGLPPVFRTLTEAEMARRA